MGADHTAGYAVTANILSCGGKVDPLKPEGQIELSRNLQIATASVDSVGLCLVHRLRHPGHPGCPGRHRGHAQRQVRLAADR